MSHEAKAVLTRGRTITVRPTQAVLKVAERDGKLWGLHPTKGWRLLPEEKEQP